MVFLMMEAGLAMSLGMDIVKAPGATGDYRSDFMSKANTLISTMTKSDKEYVFILLLLL